MMTGTRLSGTRVAGRKVVAVEGGDRGVLTGS